MRNLMATLLLSQGTPMILAGDEFARTQNGNNNAYCQNNETSWLSWNHDEKKKSLITFVQRLNRLRHKYPILRRNLFLTGEFDKDLEVKDVTWINANGTEMEDHQWTDADMRCFGMLMDGRAQTTGIRQRGREATLLIVINGCHELVGFTLPECAGGSGWSSLIDTNVPDAKGSAFAFGSRYDVTARSLLLFALRRRAPARDSASLKWKPNTMPRRRLLSSMGIPMTEE